MTSDRRYFLARMVSRKWPAGLGALCLAALACTPVGAQTAFEKLLGTLLPTGVGPASAPLPSPAASAAAAREAARLNDTFQPNAAALNELKVDRSCSREEENFDVFSKALAYGGQAAQMRLQRLIQTDFEQSQLSENDRKMLKYLAYTTVWIPASVETNVGFAYAKLKQLTASDQEVAPGRSARKARERLDERVQQLKQSLTGFPGEVNVQLNPDLRDGAFSQLGGTIVVSNRFLGLMDQDERVRDVVLAHELSHLYKRHTLKEFQYQLINSAAGFQLMKRMLGKVNPSAGVSFLPDFLFYGQVVNELLSVLQETRVAYSMDQELEADACAITWLQRSDIEPKVAWQVFGSLLTDPGAPQDEASTTYQARHPSPAERVKNVETALNKKAKPTSTPKPPAGKKPPG